MSDALKGEALALVALLMFSSNIILTRVASRRIPIGVGFLVSVLANIAFSALLFAIELALRRRPLEWDWTALALFAAAGVFSTYLGRWFFFESITRLGPARASVFQASSPLFTAVIAWVLLAEALGARSLAAMAIAIAGLLLVSSSPRQLVDASGAPAARAPRANLRTLLRAGLMLGIASSAAYATGNVLRAIAIRRWDEPVLGALMGAIAALAVQWALNPGNLDTLRQLRTVPRSGVVMFAAGGAVTITAQMLVISAMAYVPVAIVALITLCTPLVVFPLSYFLLRNEEGITARTVAGGALVLAGIAWLVGG